MTDNVANELDALEAKAKKYFKQQEFFAAIEHFQAILEQDEKRVSAHLGLAAAAFSLEDYEVAAKHYDRVTKLAPMNGAACINLGAVYNRMGKYQEASTALRKGMQRDRNSAEGYFNMAFANRMLKQLSLAISSYREAIRINPEFIDAYLNLGDVYLEMKNFSQAKVQFNKVLELDPENKHAQRGMAKTQDAQSTSRNSISPFGRLVTENQLAENQKGRSVRELSDSERLEDRQAAYDLASDIKSLSEDFLKIAKESLGANLIDLNRTVMQSEEAPTELYSSVQRFKSALGQFNDFKEVLEQKSNALRQHDAKYR